MQKKLTITIDETVYDGLHRVIGRGKISQFIESLVKPHVECTDLDAGYRDLAEYELASGDETLKWIDAVVGDVGALLD